MNIRRLSKFCLRHCFQIFVFLATNIKKHPLAILLASFSSCNLSAKNQMQPVYLWGILIEPYTWHWYALVSVIIFYSLGSWVYFTFGWAYSMEENAEMEPFATTNRKIPLSWVGWEWATGRGETLRCSRRWAVPACSRKGPQLHQSPGGGEPCAY